MFAEQPDPVFEPNAIRPYNSIYLLEDFGNVIKFRSGRKKRVKEHWDYCCAYCGNDENITIDHITPKALGGLDTLENLTTACFECQVSKNHLEMDLWYFRQDFWERDRYDKIKAWQSQKHF